MDITPSTKNPTWVDVPDCSDPADQQICQYTENPENDSKRVVLLAPDQDPPPVRYSYGGGMLSGVRSAVRDVEQAMQRFAVDVRGWFGGGGE